MLLCKAVKKALGKWRYAHIKVCDIRCTLSNAYYDDDIPIMFHQCHQLTINELLYHIV